MSDYVYLSGSEDVKSGASQMAQAARDMQGAASLMWEAVGRLEQVLAEDRMERERIKGDN